MSTAPGYTCCEWLSKSGSHRQLPKAHIRKHWTAKLRIESSPLRLQCIYAFWVIHTNRSKATIWKEANFFAFYFFWDHYIPMNTDKVKTPMFLICTVRHCPFYNEQKLGVYDMSNAKYISPATFYLTRKTTLGLKWQSFLEMDHVALQLSWKLCRSFHWMWHFEYWWAIQQLNLGARLEENNVYL